MKLLVPMSERALTLIRANVTPGHKFDNNATREDGDVWMVPLSSEVVDRLESHKMTGETLSDVVERILSPKS